MSGRAPHGQQWRTLRRSSPSSEVTRRIRDQERAAVSRAEERLQRLEQEIRDLRRTGAELEQLSHTDDHVHFLQVTEDLPAGACTRVRSH